MRLFYVFCSLLTLINLSLTAQPDHCVDGLENYRQFRFHEAQKMLNECYTADSSRLDILEKLAYCHYKLGNLKEAAAEYRSLLQRDSLNISARNQLATIFISLGQPELALEQYAVLISQDSTNPYYHKQTGLLYNKLGNLSHAHMAMLRSHELNSGDLTVINFLSKLYINTYKFDAAGEMLIRGLKVDHQHLPLLHTQMRLFHKTRSWEEALLTSNKVLLLGDSSVQVMKLTGMAHYHLQNYPLAIYFLKETVENTEAKEVLHYYLGLAYQNTGELQEAEDHLELAIDYGISDYLPLYYEAVAKTYEEAGEFPKAIEAYKIAYESSGNKVILYHLARAYDTYYHDKSPARRYYEQYLASSDTLNDEQMEYARERLSEMKKVEHFSTDTMN